MKSTKQRILDARKALEPFTSHEDAFDKGYRLAMSQYEDMCMTALSHLLRSKREAYEETNRSDRL